MSLNPEYLTQIKTLPSLIRYLRDELDWPIEADDFEELTFDYEPKELGIDTKTAAKIEEIKQLRPLVTNQPWAIFFVKFEPKRLPVIALRRILSRLVIKKRASARKSDLASWSLNDLLFISDYGEGNQRHITFAHFSQDDRMGDLPTLKVLGWDDEDTVLHLEQAHKVLKEKLRWPSDPQKVDEWREQWASIFTLRHKEVITISKDLAIQLAHLATAIRKRVSTILSIESENGPLKKLMNAFKQALIQDLYEDAFADMYAQTITYGLLSARVSRPAGLVADNLTDMVPVTNPFLKELLSTFLTLGGRKGKIDFDELGINEVVHALRNANMEAVLRDFGDKNPQEDPVIHFYELFLKEYNPDLRMKRGVFYTPRPVVSFIVRSVDEILRSEFGLEDGLADTTTWGEMVKRFPEMKKPQGANPEEPFVQILDPALGTGTFLVEIIDVIHKTMTAKWQKAGHPNTKLHQLWNEYVPKHLLPRLYGFELLMAPYAIAHMKIGLKLWETGYRFGSDERTQIYLTNSLEPPSDIQKDLPDLLPALATEVQAVNEVKRQKRFTVVIGNPPYSVNSANRTEFTASIISSYLEDLQERYVKPLHDDYIKFVGLAQNLLSHHRPSLLGMITNNGYLGGVIHRKMRESLLGTFDTVHIVDLHGNSLIKEKTEDGAPDENVFDIQQGVSIFVATKSISKKDKSRVFVVDLRGKREEKYSWLAINRTGNADAKLVEPRRENYFFTSTVFSHEKEYDSYMPLRSIFPQSSIGILTNRDWLVVAFTKEELVSRLEVFFSSKISDQDLLARFPELQGDGWWDYISARKPYLTRTEITNSIVRVLYRPFDVRFMFLSSRLVNRPRLEVMVHLLRPNRAFVVSRITMNKEFNSCFVSKFPVEQKCAESTRGVYCMPFYVWGDRTDLISKKNRRCSIPEKLVSQFIGISPTNPLTGDTVSGTLDTCRYDILDYIYAICYSPTYRERYRENLKVDFPRIPLTSSLELFRALAHIGGELVAFHLMESSKLENHLTKFVGKGDNEVIKIRYEDKTVWINSVQGFQGVPDNVWNFHIGGYQVCEKWLTKT